MSHPNRHSSYRARALGIAFLCVLLPAIGIGVIETILTLPEFAPTPRELAYGAGIHLLFALAAVCAARLFLWRAQPRVFVPAGVGMFILVELCFTASFWFLKSPFAPPFASSFGKLFAAVTVAIAFVIGVAVMWMLVRFSSRVRWRAWSAGWRGWSGIAFLLFFVLCNAVCIVTHYAGARAPLQAVQNAHSSSDAAPDVFIILIDALRFDHLSCNGYARPTSPAIDALFTESYVFENAYTPSNKTVPSIVSYFTGLYPTSHQVIGPFQGFPPRVPTVAEQFRSYGYATAAFVGNSLMSAGRGFDRGFNTFSPRGLPWWTYHGRTGLEAFLNILIVPADAASGARINRELFAWLDSHSASPGPRFVYLHYMEPHSFYDPPREHYDAVAPGLPPGPKSPPMFHEYAAGDGPVDWESLAEGPVVSDADLRGMIARYDGEIHLADRYVGEVLKILRAAGVYDNAHIIFLSDHGEEFGDHGGWFHGHSIYDELTRCPLAYRPPGGVSGDAGGNAPGGVMIERPIAVVDFLMTLFELLEMDPLPLFEGTPVVELFETPPPVERLPVVSSLPPQLYSVRFGSWKLIRRGDPSSPVDLLFNLAADPRERNDLALEHPDTLDMLRDLLEEVIAEREELRLGELESTLDPLTLERLRSLGYIK